MTRIELWISVLAYSCIYICINKYITIFLNNFNKTLLVLLSKAWNMFESYTCKMCNTQQCKSNIYVMHANFRFSWGVFYLFLGLHNSAAWLVLVVVGMGIIAQGGRRRNAASHRLIELGRSQVRKLSNKLTKFIQGTKIVMVLESKVTNGGHEWGRSQGIVAFSGDQLCKITKV